MAVIRPERHAVPLFKRRSPMVKTSLLGTSKGSFLAAVLCCGLAPAQSSLSVASKIVASANGFLGSLDEGQRSKVQVVDSLAYRKRELFEYWGHEACLLPISLYPLVRYRMHKHTDRTQEYMRSKRGGYMARVYGEVAERGP